MMQRKGQIHLLVLVVLVGLLDILPERVVGEQNDATYRVGPQRGLMANVASKGAQVRIWRQLPSSSTTPSTTTSTTLATTLPTYSTTPTASLSVSTSSPASTTTMAPKVTRELVFYVAELREVDANGNKIKQTDNNFRSFNSFGNLEFNISRLQPPVYTIPNSQVPSEALAVDANLPNLLGHINLDTCATKANGTVTLGDEVMTLMEGQLKISIEVDHWQWCDGRCPGSQPAKFLEADIVVQVPTGRVVKDVSQDQSYGYPKRFSLGQDAWTDFSNKVFVDGSFRNMSSGFPKLSLTDSKNIITVRIPRFNISATYDINFEPGYTPSDDDDDRPVGGANDLEGLPMLLLVSIALMELLIKSLACV